MPSVRDLQGRVLSRVRVKMWGAEGALNPSAAPPAPQREWSRPRLMDQGQSQTCKGRSVS